MQNNNEKQNIGDKINNFVQKNRKGIFISFGILVFLFLGFIAYIFVSDSMNAKAIAELEELNRKYTDLESDISAGISTDEIESLTNDLSEFAQRSKGFPASRAWAMIGQIYSERKDWPLAEEAWLNSANAGEKTYLGPIALFQAAAVCEEQGKFEEAIELYKRCISSNFEFPSAPRAQFSVGRLYEQIEDFPAALDAYRNVLVNYNNIPVWQHLARSRITAIEVR